MGSIHQLIDHWVIYPEIITLFRNWFSFLNWISIYFWPAKFSSKWSNDDRHIGLCNGQVVNRQHPIQWTSYEQFDAIWCPWATIRTWASFQIRKIVCCACAGNAVNVFLRHRLHRKPLVSDSGMHQGTCVTHVPWCMSGSLSRGGRENVPGIPGTRATRNFTYLIRGP